MACSRCVEALVADRGGVGIAVLIIHHPSAIFPCRFCPSLARGSQFAMRRVGARVAVTGVNGRGYVRVVSDMSAGVSVMPAYAPRNVRGVHVN